jgi:hypothetical protein
MQQVCIVILVPTIGMLLLLLLLGLAPWPIAPIACLKIEPMCRRRPWPLQLLKVLQVLLQLHQAAVQAALQHCCCGTPTQVILQLLLPLLQVRVLQLLKLLLQLCQTAVQWGCCAWRCAGVCWPMRPRCQHLLQAVPRLCEGLQGTCKGLGGGQAHLHTQVHTHAQQQQQQLKKH